MGWDGMWNPVHRGLSLHRRSDTSSAENGGKD